MLRWRHLIIAVASSAFFHGIVAGAEAPPLTVEQQEVVKLSQAWLDAFNHRDLETFASYIADDYIGSTDDGVLTTKDRLVKWLSKRPPEYGQRKDLHDIQVHLDGDTAIVNYLITSLRTWGDTPNRQLSAPDRGFQEKEWQVAHYRNPRESPPRQLFQDGQNRLQCI